MMLTPEEVDSLLYLTEEVCKYTEAYSLPTSKEHRRDVRLGHTIFVLRARDHGFAGALWRLCAFVDSMRARVPEPPVNEDDTLPFEVER